MVVVKNAATSCNPNTQHTAASGGVALVAATAAADAVGCRRACSWLRLQQLHAILVKVDTLALCATTTTCLSVLHVAYRGAYRLKEPDVALKADGAKAL